MKEQVAKKGGKSVQEETLDFGSTEVDTGKEEINAVMEVQVPLKLSEPANCRVGQYEKAFAPKQKSCLHETHCCQSIRR